MLGNNQSSLKAEGLWSWRGFVTRRRRLLALLALLSAALLIVAVCSFLLQLHWHRQLLLRVTSPVSSLEADHPANFEARDKHQMQEGQVESAALRGSPASPSSSQAAKTSTSRSSQKTQRFFRAATAAAAQGGVVLQWGDATVRMLRGAGVREVLFLFYTPLSASPNPVEKEEDADADPLEIFKRLAAEDREEQQHHQLLPFVAVPRQEMHRLSFFLPENAERLLPLAMVVRFDSGWIKFQTLPDAPFSIEAMRAFLSSYRKGFIVPLMRTEPPPPPTESTENVKSLVASNFARFVLEQTKHDSLVLLHANW
ncbi:hypothetical protein Efla_007818 [Eimeria flavescens]